MRRAGAGQPSGQPRPGTAFVIVLGALCFGVFLGWLLPRSPPTSASLPTSQALKTEVVRPPPTSPVIETVAPVLDSKTSGGGGERARDPRLAHLLELEQTIESTFKSCLSSYCFDEQVNVDGKKQVRIGFLSPPNSGSDTLLAMLSRAARKDLVATGLVENDTHVPAYGYGKNHGWTRIIRLVRRVVPHAHATLSAAAAASAVTPALFDLQLRQLVRWQCRLSHVAAHTKMLTVFLDDVITRPAIELDKMLSFIGIRAARSDLVDAFNFYGKTLQVELGLPAAGNADPLAHLDALPPLLIDSALTALESEVSSSDTLAKWPCKSFKDLEKSQAGKLLPIVSATLAADCSNPKVVCSVGFDQRGG